MLSKPFHVIIIYFPITVWKHAGEFLWINERTTVTHISTILLPLVCHKVWDKSLCESTYEWIVKNRYDTMTRYFDCALCSYLFVCLISTLHVYIFIVIINQNIFTCSNGIHNDCISKLSRTFPPLEYYIKHIQFFFHTNIASSFAISLSRIGNTY